MVTLKTWREANGMTLVDVGQQLGVHYSAVQKWESGARLPASKSLGLIEHLTGGAVRVQSFIISHQQYKQNRSAAQNG